jgi:hypothetical protein
MDERQHNFIGLAPKLSKNAFALAKTKLKKMHIGMFRNGLNYCFRGKKGERNL